MANKRVIDMQELSELGDGWYTFLDSATGGTKKFDMGNMLNATADAQDAAEAAQSAATSAREAADGVVSPTVTPSQITGGTRVTITDVDGTRTFDVMDGPQGEKGDTGDPAAPGSITTDMLADGAVTTDKLAPGVADGYQPALVSGSSRALLGDAETASWMERTTAADGAALIEAVHGRTLVWNQLAHNHSTNMSNTVDRVTTTSNSNGSITINGSLSEPKYLTLIAPGGMLHATDAMVSGHKYLFATHAPDGVVDQLGTESGAYSTSNKNAVIISLSQNKNASYFQVRIKAGTYSDAKIYPQLFDLTDMFGAGNEPSTVAEFEALFPEPYYPYDSGSLLPVRMEGIETVGFNLAESVYVNSVSDSFARTLFAEVDCMKPNTQYAITFKGAAGNKVYLNENLFTVGTNFTCTGKLQTFLATTVSEVSKDNWSQYVTGRGWAIIKNQSINTVVPNFTEVCINLSDPSRNGTYEPHWSSQRTIPASTYFPNGMRSAGTVYDELTEHEAIHRVGEYVVDGNCDIIARLVAGDNVRFTIAFPDGKAGTYNGIQVLLASNGAEVSYNYVIGNIDVAARDYVFMYTDGFLYTSAAAGSACKTLDEMKAWFAAHPLTLHYALATPTTTPIDPPLPLSYRTGAGGTERVMVASGTTSAPPIFATRYPLDPADLAASIAPVDGPTATTNHQVGDLLMLGFTLCKATQVIVTGETVAIGTNVTRTTVAAEIAALS